MDLLMKGHSKKSVTVGKPGTLSIFGYQLRHDLSKSFPLFTTSEKMSFRETIIEFLWSMRGGNNIMYLNTFGIKVWNYHAYKYYAKLYSEEGDDPMDMLSYSEFMDQAKSKDKLPVFVSGEYHYGDLGYNCPKVWRNWGGYNLESLDQIRNLIHGLKDNPITKRHILTSMDPENFHDVGEHLSNSMVQFRCRPLTVQERSNHRIWNDDDITFETDEDLMEMANKIGIPEYHLDCQVYQNYAIVGDETNDNRCTSVSFNIASYALLASVIAEICNMVPGEYIHTFGEIDLYKDQIKFVEQELEEGPVDLPKLIIGSEFWMADSVGDPGSVEFFKNIEVDDFDWFN